MSIPRFGAWLERYKGFHFHLTPTSVSWLNAVEGFFAKLTRQRVKGVVFKGIVDFQGHHQPLPRRNQSEPRAIHLDRRPRRHLAKAQRGRPNNAAAPRSSGK